MATQNRGTTSREIDRKPLESVAPDGPKYVKKVDKFGRAYATGKRKDSVARVWIKLGTGKITVNNRDMEAYFSRPVLRMLIMQPLVASSRNETYDVISMVYGGSLSGQAGAVRHGIAKALTNFEPDLRGVLKKSGFLTRDSRLVERSTYRKTKSRGPSLPAIGKRHVYNATGDKERADPRGAGEHVIEQTPSKSAVPNELIEAIQDFAAATADTALTANRIAESMRENNELTARKNDRIIAQLDVLNVGKRT